MNTPEVRGQFIAPVTPFTADGDLMVDAFAEILRWHLESGAGGFLIAGDNGEGWALTDAELGLLTEAAKTEAAGRVPIFTGAGAITAQRTIELCDVAARAGADGLCLQPQSYVLNGTKAEICRRFELVSRAVPLPIMLYNNPARTGLNLGVDVLEGICDVAPVVALKEASADFTKAIELDPKGAVAYRNRAVVKFRAGNTGGGTDDLVQALNLYTEAGDQKGIDDVRAVEKRFFMH